MHSDLKSYWFEGRFDAPIGQAGRIIIAEGRILGKIKKKDWCFPNFNLMDLIKSISCRNFMCFPYMTVVRSSSLAH
jgi:hypothetical protein